MDTQTNTVLTEAARAGLSAISNAATNAAKGGGSSSELKVTTGGLLLVGGMAVLQALSVVPGPWMLPAIAVSAAISVAAYAVSRGRVKSSALDAAAAVAAAASKH